jgi:hypothetical protein
MSKQLTDIARVTYRLPDQQSNSLTSLLPKISLNAVNQECAEVRSKITKLFIASLQKETIAYFQDTIKVIYRVDGCKFFDKLPHILLTSVNTRFQFEMFEGHSVCVLCGMDIRSLPVRNKVRWVEY